LSGWKHLNCGSLFTYCSSLGFLKALEKSISNNTGLKYLLIHYWRHVGTDPTHD
jgi:hypothetical protein